MKQDARKRRQSRHRGKPEAGANPALPSTPTASVPPVVLDESLSLGDGDVMSTLFFSSAPPPPPESSLALEDWNLEETEPSTLLLERKARFRRIVVAVIAVSTVGAGFALGVESYRCWRADTPSVDGR